ncbi:hypothetical protein HAP48_0043065 [Bradyrhizobium septentrionale]|uniref:Uncharacterized protein n=1 Tax=Bradyrhizobium septentrionale TaxID=1404411 RepID=A0A973W3F4_9BRAD|nr:hypothetical protein [Bradyrhizobium septentrionale]UGY15240.1 hypothetical protein HAP48_0043065 [Bradyrhizobium septentrionale]UGY23823.1 hypothetical protein HU675_0038730 [Bradyrhizobium septentrionale]
MTSEAPIKWGDAGWVIHIEPGQELVCGRVFDELRGYCVVLKFSTSRKWNALTTDAARSIAKAFRADGKGSDDALAMAGLIEEQIEFCERLNAGWEALGRPSGGYDGQVSGHA